MANISEQLREHLENGRDWEKMDTPIPGVYIVKIPATKKRPAILQLEINPLNENGMPIKRKGLFIGNKDTLIRYVEAINEDRSYLLMKYLEVVNKRESIQLEEEKRVHLEEKIIIEEEEFINLEEDDKEDDNIIWEENDKIAFGKEEIIAPKEDDIIWEEDDKIDLDKEEFITNEEDKFMKSDENQASPELIFKNRVYVQKMTKENRDSLFIEVNQKDLNINIFNPIRNLFKYGSHFFPKRFAILGEFKTGKTELGKYIVHKMKKHYKDCIALTINSKLAQYKNTEEIDDWIYNKWYIHLLQVSNPDFKSIVKKKINEFKDLRGEPKESLDKIFLISQIYKEYLKIKPEVKFIVEFDQANIIELETQFTPFYEFWRNFQGFWENDDYFSELPLFIFVIGHKSWTNFAALKDPIGRGVFDLWINYDYWNSIDIEKMYKNRLLFSITPEYQEQLIDYFLCKGIVDYFGKKLGKASTQMYLDEFFGKYFRSFIGDFLNNFEKFEDFLSYCKVQSKEERYDEKYFTEIERVFAGNPAFDYMIVFQYLSNNQNVKWFNQLFSLISDIYKKQFVSFESKDFKKYQNLDYRFIDDNFTQSPLDGMKPIYNPPIFARYDKKFTLNETFRRSLETVEGVSRGSPVSLLKKFVKSKRIGREVFIKNKQSKKMENLLLEINQHSLKIFDLIQKWVVSEYIEDNYLLPFYKIKDDTYQLKQLYEDNSTNWAIFDNMGREIANHLVDKTFPENSLIISQFNIDGLKELRNLVISQTTSSLSMAQYVKDLLVAFSGELENLDPRILKNKTIFAKNGNLKTNVLVVIDGPNALGEQYEDRLNLKTVADYAHNLDKNADLYYLTKTSENKKNQEFISRLGYKVQVSYKDIDYAVKDLISEKLDNNESPTLLLLGVKDQDYIGFIKKIRKEFKIKIQIVISSENGLSNSLKRSFSEEDILTFPEEKKITSDDDGKKIYRFIAGREGKPICWNGTGKICFPDIEGNYQPNIGEKWFCRIKEDKGNLIILTLIKKV